MTRKSETNDREQLNCSGENRPGFREPAAYKNHAIRSRCPRLRWGWLLFSCLLSLAPSLPSHSVLAVVERGALETQVQVSPPAEAYVMTQAIVATPEGPTSFLGNEEQARYGARRIRTG